MGSPSIRNCVCDQIRGLFETWGTRPAHLTYHSRGPERKSFMHGDVSPFANDGIAPPHEHPATIIAAAIMGGGQSVILRNNDLASHIRGI